MKSITMRKTILFIALVVAVTLSITQTPFRKKILATNEKVKPLAGKDDIDLSKS